MTILIMTSLTARGLPSEMLVAAKCVMTTVVNMVIVLGASPRPNRWTERPRAKPPPTVLPLPLLLPLLPAACCVSGLLRLLLLLPSTMPLRATMFARVVPSYLPLSLMASRPRRMPALTTIIFSYVVGLLSVA